MMKYIPLFLIAIGFYSCTTIQPVAPSEAYTPYQYKPKLSTLNVPVEVPVSQLETIVNKYMTGLLYEDNNLNDDDMMMKIWKHSNITLNVVGEEFKYRVPLKVWVKAGFKVEKLGITLSDYEETTFVIALNFVSKIKVNSDWKVNTVTTVSGYEWITKPVLDLGFVDIPITYIADKIIEAQKEKVGTLIDEQTVKYLQIKEYVDPAWTQIQEPIKISDRPESWLDIEPVEAQISPLMGRAGYIQAAVGMKAYVQYHLGSKPVGVVKKLPSLKQTNDETGYFALAVVSDIPYDYAEQLCKQYFEGQVYEFKNGKKKIKVEEVNLFGNNGKLVIGMKVSGSLKGAVFLSGVPYYEAASKSIRIKEMDFDLDTKNKLLKSADWLAHNVFIKKMEENLVFSIKEDLKETEAMIEKSISNQKINDYVSIDGRVTQVVPEVIYLTETGINAVVVGKGLLNVELLKK